MYNVLFVYLHELVKKVHEKQQTSSVFTSHEELVMQSLHCNAILQTMCSSCTSPHSFAVKTHGLSGVQNPEGLLHVVVIVVAHI